MTKFYKFIRAVFLKPIRAVFRIQVTDPENMLRNQGCLLCANHTSMLDVLILSAGLDCQIRYMAKKELFSIPLLKQLITALGAYPVNRGGADVSSIKRTIALLGEGQPVGIFPQGTRHPGVDPAGTPIKNGIGMITWHAKVPVVPLYIRTKDNRVRFFQKTELIVGHPISFEEMGMTGSGTAQYNAAAEKVFREICALGGYTRALPAPAASENPTEEAK